MMKRWAMGLLLAVAALMGATACQAAAAAPADDSATVLPPAIAAAKIPCTVTASRFILEGTMTTGTKGKARFYEAACQEGPGFVIVVPADKSLATAFDCGQVNQEAKDTATKGKPAQIACTLPANASNVSALQPVVTKLGVPCAIAKTRTIGSGAKATYYEMACASGAGYILSTPRTIGATEPEAFNCLDMPADSTTKCTLIDLNAYVAAETAKLSADSHKACAIKGQRYVGETADHKAFYEVACQDGSGFMLGAAYDGSLDSVTTCLNASGIMGGCTLSDTKAALTAENALYSSLAKKAGFNCDVAKYGVFPAQGSTDVVELQCSNRPDGGVGVFPPTGPAMVYDCVRATNQGYKCSFSGPEAVYPKLTAQLVARGRTSCTVNGARPFGSNDTNDYVEVSCADGGPGWVIQYPLKATKPTDLLNCAQAASLAPGGCQLPTNKRH
jgi:hypothetical protein